jgi:LysM repeat protein
MKVCDHSSFIKVRKKSRQTENTYSTGSLKAMVAVVEEDRQTNMTSPERVDSVLEDSSILDATMLDQIPEFIREEIDEDRRKPQLEVKPMLPQASIEVLNRSNEVSTVPMVAMRSERTTSGEPPESPPADELEALWPGVHHELIQPSKRQPSFYLMLGFMAGAVVSLFSVWSYSAVASKIIAGGDGNKQILVAGASAKSQASSSNDVAIETKSIDPNATLVPISNTYEVKANDTLVMIAMKNYKKVTPRLLDEIVKANGLKSANVLSLGQKLTLPNYKPQSSAIAATSSGQIH